MAQTRLLSTLLSSSLQGLGPYARRSPIKLPADYRLAFRKLGLSIGLQAADDLDELIRKNPTLFPETHPVGSLAKRLKRYRHLGEEIESFWLNPTNREVKSWMEHPDINSVMLATSPASDGYFRL